MQSFYFLLFKQWGGVPLITSVLDPGDESQLAGITRASAEQTLQRVLDDMDEAIRHLPVKHDDANFGRFTSLVATVIKSQVKLYWASPYWNRDNDISRWEDAVDATREAYNMALQNGHALAEKYSYLFNQTGIQNEVIWTKNSPNNYECYWWDWYAMPLGYNGWNVDGPLQEIVDDFEMKESGEVPVLGYTEDNRQIINEAAYDYDPLNPWDGRDERFYSCILYHGAELQGRPIDISEGGLDDINIGAITRTRYFYNKYLDQNHNLVTNDTWTYRRFAIIRTAELYLNYAEALYQYIGSPEQVTDEFFLTARDAVNKIRTRSDVNMPLLPKGLSGAEFWERYKRERMVELAFEGHRFWDVRRWKEGGFTSISRMEITKTGDNIFSYKKTTKSLVWDDKMYLFPIPDSEIRLNPNLTQNPGW